VVKSGGEWISSIQLENAAMGHPKVRDLSLPPLALLQHARDYIAGSTFAVTTHCTAGAAWLSTPHDI